MCQTAPTTVYVHTNVVMLRCCVCVHVCVCEGVCIRPHYIHELLLLHVHYICIYNVFLTKLLLTINCYDTFNAYKYDHMGTLQQ